MCVWGVGVCVGCIPSLWLGGLLSVCVCVGGCVFVLNLKPENKRLWGEFCVGTTLQITLKIQTVHIFFLSFFLFLAFYVTSFIQVL